VIKELFGAVANQPQLWLPHWGQAWLGVRLLQDIWKSRNTFDTPGAAITRGRFRNHWEICRNPWRIFEIIDKLHAEIVARPRKPKAPITMPHVGFRNSARSAACMTYPM
jgi:hypothetical protein